MNKVNASYILKLSQITKTGQKKWSAKSDDSSHEWYVALYHMATGAAVIERQGNRGRIDEFTSRQQAQDYALAMATKLGGE